MKIKPYPETHMRGRVSVENQINFTQMTDCDLTDCDFGIQIAEDGRVWICLDGIAFIRFNPMDGYLTIKGIK